MKAIAIFVCTIALVGTSYAVTRGSAEPSHVRQEHAGTAEMVGRYVNVHLNVTEQVATEQFPASRHQMLLGEIVAVEPTYLILSQNGDDRLLVPLASVACVQTADAGPTTRPTRVQPAAG